jgi:8-oxo-dGTP pyrophosphatase MutT (NUDIX family)
MRLLKEIKDKKFPKDKSKLKIREASRAVLFDKNKLIPLLFVGKYNYHKLPGGGIDKNEDRFQALARECLEEVGSEVKITGEIGKIIEFRSKWNLEQISYCYYGKIISKGEPHFTKKELDQGFRIVWLSLKDTIKKIKSDKPENYEGSFIQKRDLRFLEEVRKIVKPK